MSTLVHEMTHHWQNHAGTPSPSNPHNKEWADKMVSMGLQPSHTGLPGGRKTGRSMSDYILPDGPFLSACRELLSGGFTCHGWIGTPQQNLKPSWRTCVPLKMQAC